MLETTDRDEGTSTERTPQTPRMRLPMPMSRQDLLVDRALEAEVAACETALQAAGEKVAAAPERYELHYEDETHLETNPYLGRVWHRVGEQPTLPAAGTNRRVTVFGSVERWGGAGSRCCRRARTGTGDPDAGGYRAGRDDHPRVIHRHRPRAHCHSCLSLSRPATRSSRPHSAVGGARLPLLRPPLAGWGGSAPPQTCLAGRNNARSVGSLPSRLANWSPDGLRVSL